MTERALTKQLDVMELGNVLSKSGYFADAKDAAQAVVKVLAGQELGFGPVASMTGINIIKGRVSPSANLIGAAIKKSGRYDYLVMELNETQCVITFYTGAGDEARKIGTSAFTIDDAKRAGLLSGDNWKKYPRNMLFARALSNGAKWFCPDVFGGPVYTPDELGVPVDGETFEVIDAEPEPEPVNENGLTDEQIITKNKAMLIARINDLNGQLAEPDEIDQTWYDEATEAELTAYGMQLRLRVNEAAVEAK